MSGLAMLALGGQAFATAYEDVFRDYQADGRITPCYYSAATLDQALAQIPTDTDRYNPDFREKATAERDRMRSGACGTNAAPARLRIIRVRANPSGPDSRPSALRQEYVSIRNAGSATVKLRGWAVANGRNRFHTFRSGTLRSGRSLNLRSGRGRSSGSRHYWNSRREVWRNRGDQAKLFAPGRRLVQRYRYGNFR
jgi:Lamin Tail Domain